MRQNRRFADKSACVETVCRTDVSARRPLTRLRALQLDLRGGNRQEVGSRGKRQQ